MWGFPGGSVISRLQYRRPGFDPWIGKVPQREAWQPPFVLFPRELQGQKSAVGYSPGRHRVGRG